MIFHLQRIRCWWTMFGMHQFSSWTSRLLMHNVWRTKRICSEQIFMGQNILSYPMKRFCCRMKEIIAIITTPPKWKLTAVHHLLPLKNSNYHCYLIHMIVLPRNWIGVLLKTQIIKRFITKGNSIQYIFFLF